MTDVTIRELRNRAGHIVDRVAGGERVIVTRRGKPVAELRSVNLGGRTAEELVRRWRRLPRVNGLALRGDVDAALDPRL